MNTPPNGSSHPIEGMGSSSSGTWTLHINVLAALIVGLGTALAFLCNCRHGQAIEKLGLVPTPTPSSSCGSPSLSLTVSSLGLPPGEGKGVQEGLLPQ